MTLLKCYLISVYYICTYYLERNFSHYIEAFKVLNLQGLFRYTMQVEWETLEIFVYFCIKFGNIPNWSFLKWNFPS